MISEKHRCIFVHIPKTAGTSIEEHLGLFDNYSYGIQDHRLISELREAMLPEDFDTYFKFAFIRNPWDRVVSWYKNVLDEPGHRALLGVPEGCSLRRFLTRHRSIWGLQSQSHWIRESDGTIPLDFIGRFENLEDDYAHVCERLGLDNVLPPSVRATGTRNAVIRVKVRFRSPDAGEVLLVWGLNEFTRLPFRLPPETFLTESGSHLNTPMQREGDVFIAQFDVEANTRLDYAFTITRTSSGEVVKTWKGASSEGEYHTTNLTVANANETVTHPKSHVGVFQSEEWSELDTRVCRLSMDLARAVDRRAYTSFYDDATRAIVAKRYAEEIKIFGYRFGEEPASTFAKQPR